jgi:hypothetical protein
MGGDVAVASVPGSGSAFIVGLPAVADIPHGAVVAAIGVASDAEEVELEERAVLRALRADGRAGHGGSRGVGSRGGISAPASERTDGTPHGAEMPVIDAA